MPIDKTAILQKALADIKQLARELKTNGLKAKYGPAPADETDEPDEGTPAEEAMDATEGEPGLGDAPEMADDAPPEEDLDDDKIKQLVAMLQK